MADSLGYTDVGRGHKDDIDRQNATWKTTADSILRPCLAKPPSYDAEGANYDADLLLLQAH